MDEAATKSAPRVFISYSWTTPDHEDWVLELATSLVESGVDVKLDKWDLREGQETSAFMESMVTDPGIRKVIIVCDRKYAEKSNKREGGAGTEAQIISKGIFAGEDEGKFVVVSTEHDEAGKPTVPAYYTSRMFIDFTEESRRTDKFEQLLRWIFDKPLHKRPALGQAPRYITSDREAITLPTGATARRVNDAITNGKSFAYGALEDYFETFARYTERFRPEPGTALDGEDLRNLLDDFIPFRNEALEVVRNTCRYLSEPAAGKSIHKFLEDFTTIFHPLETARSWNPTAYDVPKFLGWELFLYICTISRKSNRPDIYNELVTMPFVERASRSRSARDPRYFGTFCNSLELFTYWDRSLATRALVPEANELKSRCAQTPVSFEEIEETDFLLFLRASMLGVDHWVPQTLVFKSSSYSGSFPCFIRATSERYFKEGLEPFLGVNIAKLREFISYASKREVWVPTWQHITVNVPDLCNAEKLCSSP